MDEKISFIDLSWYDMQNIRRLLKEYGSEYLYNKVDRLMEDNDKAELFTIDVKE